MGDLDENCWISSEKRLILSENVKFFPKRLPFSYLNRRNDLKLQKPPENHADLHNSRQNGETIGHDPELLFILRPVANMAQRSYGRMFRIVQPVFSEP